MKRAAIMVALAGLACAGVTPAVQAQDKVFALVPKNMNNPFFDQARDGCLKAAAEIGGIECYY
ncbi:MAG: sugar ABC transporter substrate-binding protein, partial [Geminicoccaceae bacterium]